MKWRRMSQNGERADIELCGRRVPRDVEVRGWLMDSLVVSSECHWDASAYIAEMEEIDIILTVKRFPATEEEYFEFFKNEKGRAFNTTLLTSRDIRRFNAKSYSMRYLFGD